MKASDLRKAMTASPGKESIHLSTGSTLLNLACSDKWDGGFLSGHYYFLVGDSSSGKTFLSLTCMAEAVLNPAFASHQFVLDNAEDGALMDVSRFFGRKVAKRLRSPRLEKGREIHSSTLVEFYRNVNEALDEGPCIYVLDSMDALTTEDDTEDATYGTKKAKLNSSRLKAIIPRLRDTGSILIIISQTRDNIGFGAQFNPKTRSGGHALKFFATLEIWTSVAGHLKARARGKDREQGIITKAKVKKNRITGKDRVVEIPLYHSYGIDDLGSCVRYLVEEKHWEETKGKIEAPEFDMVGTPEKIIEAIEDLGAENELRQLVQSVWSELERSVEVRRKPRYT